MRKNNGSLQDARMKAIGARGRRRSLKEIWTRKLKCWGSKGSIQWKRMLMKQQMVDEGQVAFNKHKVPSEWSHL